MINVQNLSKKYINIHALDRVNFHIRQGEIYGLLGPNGAGKSTTINILSTVALPNEGEVILDSFNLRTHPDKCKNILGVVPQEISLYDELTALENLYFWGGLYKINRSELKQRASSLLDMMGLTDRKNDRIDTFSGGMKRRVNIAAALLHSPKILLMDEPTVGIDPHSRNLIFDVIEELNSNGLTIIYTTHYMEEAERLCDRISIIDSGKIIAEGTLEELRNISNIKESIHIDLTSIPSEKSLNAELFSEFKITQQNNSIDFFTNNSGRDLSKIISLLTESGHEISSLEMRKANLETVFLNLTGRQLRD
jgi:ABC-2 type transport system ATP-binding protein